MIDEIEMNMIEDNITIHDQFQFEIKWAYKFHTEKKSSTYNIESYFFIPQNFGINKISYTKYDFYNDLRTYIRFKTPTVLLQSIADGPKSLIENLKTVFSTVIDQPSRQELAEYEDTIKLFCCQFKSSLREHVMFIGKNGKPRDISYLVDQYIECVEKISKEYRGLRRILNVPTFNKKQYSKYLFGDEYISLIIEEYTYSLLNLLESTKNSETKNNYTESLLNIIKREIKYRTNSNYPSIPQVDSDNEVFVFRKSILKKFMDSILFLDVRTENDGKFVEQLVFGIAAGLSMIFATVIAFYSQFSYGNLSLPFFAALVISYMFKDRIKEILRIYLSGKLGRVLYNYKTYLQTRDRDKIGWCKEHFCFLNESEAPEEVIKLRNKDHITEIENSWMGEQVILYKKLIRLHPNNFGSINKIAAVDSINDIMRFNIQKFLAKMDNPVRPIFALYNNTYKKIFAKRVYHLNLIIKYSFEDKSLYKRFRIILNRKGIRSIELVNYY